MFQLYRSRCWGALIAGGGRHGVVVVLTTCPVCQLASSDRAIIEWGSRACASHCLSLVRAITPQHSQSIMLQGVHPSISRGAKLAVGHDSQLWLRVTCAILCCR